MNIKLETLIDILLHISKVQENLSQVRAILKARGITHDRTKLLAIEFDAFVKARSKFKEANYGSPEYQECVNMIRPSIDHHHANNRHHTAFHKNGFSDMNLFDILEMLADWEAASRRNPDLPFADSLPKAFERYSIPLNVQRHIVATLKYLKWI
ncbi:MAG TPA: hypothetical protein ENG48_12085 [Candidatus Atribacteria bacterium]|nr:hypothetical protein [Candidatus Atribacteria bacterium]